MRFKDKVVLVLGGNSGIGLATAKAFAAEGARVRLTGRSPQTLRQAELEVPGSRSFQSDIADVSSTKEVISRIEATDGHIDVLFVNAGIGGFAPLRDITEQYWDEVHAVNLKGCIFAIQKAVRLMRSGGSIVVTGSIGAHAAVNGNLVYAAAKSGLYAAVKIIAGELVSEGIRVNMVSPGPIETPLLNRNPGMDQNAVAALRKMMIEKVPMHRMGEGAEVAKAVLFLASEDASFITAANLFIDGGLLELR